MDRRLELVFGAVRPDPIPLIQAKYADAVANNMVGWPFGSKKNRASHVLRLGRAAIRSPDPQKLVSWYRDILGLKFSEPVYAGDETRSETSLPRLDREGCVGPSVTSWHSYAARNRGSITRVHLNAANSSDLGMGQMFMLERGYCWGRWPAFRWRATLRLLDGSIRNSASNIMLTTPVFRPSRNAHSKIPNQQDALLQ